MRFFYKNSLKTKTRVKLSIAQQNIFTNIFSSFLTRDVAIKYRVTSIEESSQTLRVPPFFALGKRIQIDDDGRRRSRIHSSEVKCQTARHRDATSLLRIRCDEFLAIRERGLRPRRFRRPGSRRSPKKRFNAPSEGDRERCLRQHVLWAWSNAKEIYCLARVFMAYPRFVRYIFTSRVQRGMHEQTE